jgi:hypothetical protein
MRATSVVCPRARLRATSSGKKSFFKPVPDPNPEPDPPDPHAFGPHGSGSPWQGYGSGSDYGSFYHKEKIVRKTLIPTVM